MSTPLLATKLYIPPPRPNLVVRPRLLHRLDEGLRIGHRLSAVPAFVPLAESEYNRLQRFSNAV